MLLKILIIICIILLCAFLYTLHLLSKKIIIDKNEKDIYEKDIEQLKQKKLDLNIEVITQNELISFNNNKIEELQEKYQNIEKHQEENLRTIYNQRKQDFENELNLQKTNLQLEFNKEKEQIDQQINLYETAAQESLKEAEEKIKQATTNALNAEQRFQALLNPLKKYEAEQQQKLYYTIQVPNEYKEDINFLLTTVSQKIQHPDIINKLIWAEYVKPYIDETFKRAEIKDEPGIYKITNIKNGKCYIGKSTNIKKRLTDHFKSSIGITSIADQAVHHEILREGYWNWMIEPIIYCDKDKLNEMEKYYIDFFKAQEYGYNKKGGG